VSHKTETPWQAEVILADGSRRVEAFKQSFACGSVYRLQSEPPLAVRKREDARRHGRIKGGSLGTDRKQR